MFFASLSRLLDLQYALCHLDSFEDNQIFSLHDYAHPLSLALYQLAFRLNQIKLLIFESFLISIIKKYFVTYYHIKSNVNTNFYENKIKSKKN